MIQTFAEPCDAVVFLQTIEHVEDPGELLEHFKRISDVAYISTPNVLTLAPKGAERSGNPWHVHEYRAQEFGELLDRHFAHVEILGLFHARMLRVHELAIRHARWDDVHAKLGVTKRFYDRFVPAISARDFALRQGDLDRALDFVAVCRA
jgi:hypothetical protein